MRILLTLILTLLCTGGTGLQAQPVPPAVLAAARTALQNLDRDFPAFIRQVHPQLGLSYYESGQSINEDRPLNKGQLTASWEGQKDDLIVTSDYNAENGAYVTNAAGFLRRIAVKHDFLHAADIRYNIKSLSNTTDVFHPARPGESLVSFHVNETGNELGWSCLILRLRAIDKKYYVAGMDYMYWTP